MIRDTKCENECMCDHGTNPVLEQNFTEFWTDSCAENLDWWQGVYSVHILDYIVFWYKLFFELYLSNFDYKGFTIKLGLVN